MNGSPKNTNSDLLYIRGVVTENKHLITVYLLSICCYIVLTRVITPLTRNLALNLHIILH